jgi:hypothetical protein
MYYFLPKVGWATYWAILFLKKTSGHPDASEGSIETGCVTKSRNRAVQQLEGVGALVRHGLLLHLLKQDLCKPCHGNVCA